MIVDDLEMELECLGFDRHVFPLSITEVCRGTTTWRESERLVR